MLRARLCVFANVCLEWRANLLHCTRSCHAHEHNIAVCLESQTPPIHPNERCSVALEINMFERPFWVSICCRVIYSILFSERSSIKRLNEKERDRERGLWTIPNAEVCVTGVPFWNFSIVLKRQQTFVSFLSRYELSTQINISWYCLLPFPLLLFCRCCLLIMSWEVHRLLHSIFQLRTRIFFSYVRATFYKIEEKTNWRKQGRDDPSK